MNPQRPTPQAKRPGQITSQELRDDLLQFVRLKFYENDPIQFVKDQKHLLSWVILYPAGWLIGKGVTLPGERYKKILTDILLEAVRHGNTGRIRYTPAWLRQVIQSHFRAHGEEYYNEAKSARNLAEAVLLHRWPSAGPRRP
jgi:hypothetical protein